MSDDDDFEQALEKLEINEDELLAEYDEEDSSDWGLVDSPERVISEDASPDPPSTTKPQQTKSEQPAVETSKAQPPPPVALPKPSTTVGTTTTTKPQMPTTSLNKPVVPTPPAAKPTTVQPPKPAVNPSVNVPAKPSINNAPKPSMPTATSSTTSNSSVSVPKPQPAAIKPPVTISQQQKPPPVVPTTASTTTIVEPQTSVPPPTATAQPAARNPPPISSEITEEEEESNEQQQLKKAASTQSRQNEQPSDSSGGGWGWGGGLTGWGKTFVQDMGNLAESFQQHVLKDLEEDDDDDNQTVGGNGSSSLVQGRGAGGSSSSNKQDPEAEKTREVLDRLASKAEDPDLVKLTEAVDGQVDAITANVGKTFNSFLTWGRETVAPITSKVEQVSSTTKRDLLSTAQGAAPAVSAARTTIADVGNRAGHSIGQTFSAFSRTAKELLLDASSPGPHSAGKNDEEEHAVLSFEECFAIYGGQDAEEELLALSNECSRLCNKIRAKMGESEQAEVDKLLAELVPVFNAELNNSTQETTGSEDGVVRLMALSRGHDVVADLANAACKAAVTLGSKAASELEVEVAPGEEEQGAVEEETSTSSFDNNTITKKRRRVTLDSFPEESSKRIAEVSSVCLERLLNLGKSLNSALRTGRLSNDGIDWSKNKPLGSAFLLRKEAERMWQEVDTVINTFVKELESLAAGNSGNDIKQIRETGKKAEDKVQECFKSLIYILWQKSCIGKERFE